MKGKLRNTQLMCASSLCVQGELEPPKRTVKRSALALASIHILFPGVLPYEDVTDMRRGYPAKQGNR
ncbi:MAG: hypothetical protein WBX25_08395 [Rhodomicrobium sp.]